MSDPRLVDFLRSRKAQRTPGSESASSPVQREDFLNEPLPNSTSPQLDHTIKAQESQRDTMEEDEEDENQLVAQPPITGKWVQSLFVRERSHNAPLHGVVIMLLHNLHIWDFFWRMLLQHCYSIALVSWRKPNGDFGLVCMHTALESKANVPDVVFSILSAKAGFTLGLELTHIQDCSLCRSVQLSCEPCMLRQMHQFQLVWLELS